jgi:ribosomal protein L11 methylase PrmA
MMPDISDYLTEDAPLILSGIIYMRADEIRASLKEHGYTIIREEQENDWIAIMAKKKG